MPFSAIIMLICLGVLLVFSGFFSGSETALFSLTRHQRAKLARTPSVVGRTLTTLLSETRGLLITLLLCNMTINVMYFVVSSVLLIRASESPRVNGAAVVVLTVAPLMMVILFGEVLPKLVASRLPVAFARIVALPLMVVHRVLTPIRVTSSVAVITPLSRLLSPPKPSPNLSPEELDAMLQLSSHHGVIDQDEQRVLRQVLELSQLTVKQLMTPRVDVQAFEESDDPSRLLSLIRRTRLRHIPVFRKDIDEVVGMLYTRQVLMVMPKTSEQVKPLIRQVNYVPEQQRADRALIELRKSGTTFAVVVDEYGGTAGIVTLEDIVEHMVGDIPGAFEASGVSSIEPMGVGRWRVGADLSVHDWSDVFGRHARFDEARRVAVADTVGGLVMAELGRIAEPQDTITLGNVVITVETMNGNRIESVLIELQKTPATQEGGES